MARQANSAFNIVPVAPELIDPVTGLTKERDLETLRARTHTELYLRLSIRRLCIMADMPDGRCPKARLVKALETYRFALLPRQYEILRRFLHA